MVVRWTFTDMSIATPSSYTFEINPNEGGTPTRKKTTVTMKTSASDGNPLIFEGSDEPLEFSFGGVLLTEEHLDVLQTWYEKHHQILLTDDLGRENWIYITAFDIRRERASHHRFKHSYTASATLLDWA